MMATSTDPSRDTIARAMTNDGAFRVIVAETTRTTRGAVEAQQAHGENARVFSDLLTGVALVRETMAPELRVQGILKPRGQQASMVADSHPSGDVRGLLGLGERQARFPVAGSMLQMMRTLHDGRLHQGYVQVPDDADISKALMVYMQESEQVATMIAVSTKMENGGVVRSGGYLVQLLPEVGRGPLMVMAERLEDYRDIEPLLERAEFNPEWLIGELLHAMPFTLLGESGLRFGCWCSPVRMMAAIATLPRTDVAEMVEDGKPIELSCDYCRRDYSVAPAELRGLLEDS